MVRPCAKYARLNCEHRQKFRRQNAVGYFMSACSHTRGAVYLRLVRRRWIAFLNCYAPTNKRQQKMSSQFVGLPSPRLRGHFLGVVLCRNKYKRAITARFRNVADGNISRLRNAQAFHAAVKRPPYFTFARQRRHFTAGRSVSGSPSPRLRGLIWAWLRHNNKENK